MTGQPIDERPSPALPSPVAITALADRLRTMTAYQRLQPLDRILKGAVLRTIADVLDEAVRLMSAPGRDRERRLQERADVLAILATSRRLPLAAIEGLVRRADEAGAESVSVAAIRQALAATEPE